MNQKIIFLLIISIFGILILFTLSLIIQPKQLTLSQISGKNLNQEIKIEARILNIADFPQSKFQILTLVDRTGNITATSNSNKQLKINQSKIYIFTGKIQEYKNEIQLSLDKIEEK